MAYGRRVGSSSWSVTRGWQLPIAAFLAVMFTQLGPHAQIFRSRKANYVIQLPARQPGHGLSYGWWVSKHNRHHAHPSAQTPTW